MFSLDQKIRRFIIVGILTVGIDFIFYNLCLIFSFSINISKAIGFCSGMIFAWFANRHYTFSAQQKQKRIAGFVILYLMSLALNVGVNMLLLFALSPIVFAKYAAFVGATACSASLNFIGMKYIVFK